MVITICPYKLNSNYSISLIVFVTGFRVHFNDYKTFESNNTCLKNFHFLPVHITTDSTKCYKNYKTKLICQYL